MRKDLYKDLYTKEETHWWHRSKRRFVKQFITTYAEKKSNSILDIGCGTGKNMEELALYGDIWGIDTSSDALSFCKKRGLTHIKKGRAERLPFKNNTFDIVCALDVLEHVDDKVVVKEVKRVLKESGFIVITVPAYNWLWSKWDEILHHKRRYTKKSLEKVLKNEGLYILRNTYIHSLLLIPLYIIRKIKQLQSNAYSSDFRISNSIINKTLFALSKLEQRWINRYDMPFGTSVLCIAQKKPQKSLS